MKLNLASSNTAGLAWEFTTLTFLDADGTPFSTPPTVPAHLGATGSTGSPSMGNYLWADTQTVVGVGTDATQPGSNGTSDGVLWVSAAQTGVNGPRIGGFAWRTTLEDVRGTSNGPTQFSSSFREVHVRGDVSRDAVADVRVAKAASSSTVEQGEILDYTITVENAGPDPAAAIEMVDVLPDGMAFLGVEIPADWSCDLPTIGSTGTVSCTTPTLEIAAVATIVIQTMVSLGVPLGQLVNTATVSSASVDPAPDNDGSTASVEIVPAATTTTSTTTTTSPPTTNPALPPDPPSPTTTSTTATPTTATTTTTPAIAPTTTQPGARLPQTGSNLGGSWLVGIVLLLGSGAFLVVLGRRPDSG